MTQAQKRRSRLADIQSDWQNGEIDPFYIPSFLDRTKWDEEEWERHRKYQQKIVKDLLDKQKEENRRIYAKTKRLQNRKIIRERRRELRKEQLADRKGRRLRRQRMYEEHNSLVLDALHKGDETVGQIRKRTNLETREARRALRRLVKMNLVTRTSERRYAFIPKRKRKRLAIIDNEE